MVRCIPRDDKCGLLVRLPEDTSPELPVLGGKWKEGKWWRCWIIGMCPEPRLR
ncbi:hypothetical protein [Methanolobus sp.]|uniref:hypothetical protein n=1 Tax=Methanolobus sp. TaxID=1874737 RepID=UPI00272F51CF|nr:hypothetical protein [Methanolobus sp.]